MYILIYIYIHTCMHYIGLHSVTLHDVHYIIYTYIKLNYIILHYITLYYSPVHSMSFHFIPVHSMSFRSSALHYIHTCIHVHLVYTYTYVTYSYHVDVRICLHFYGYLCARNMKANQDQQRSVHQKCKWPRHLQTIALQFVSGWDASSRCSQVPWAFPNRSMPETMQGLIHFTKPGRMWETQS